MKRLVVLFVMSSALLRAQTADTTAARTAGDSALLRARELVKDGLEADGRKIIDSVLKATTPDSAVWAEALYWRGALAATAADAERDYRRLLIETPLSPRAEDALLQLANLLQARGDRRGASDHLQRFMLTYANNPARPRVALALVRLLFEQGPQQQARACAAYRMGRDAIPHESLELRNQLEFYAPRCIGEMAPAPRAVAESATVAPAAAQPTAPTATHPTAPAAPATPTPTARSTASTAASAASASFYSVQVAAYNSREPAQSLVTLLLERDLEARVDGTAAPFRVRVGKYATRAEAVKAAAALKAQGHSGFITLVSGSTR